MRLCCRWLCRRYLRLWWIKRWLIPSVVCSFVLWYQHQNTDNLGSVLPLKVTNITNITVSHVSSISPRKINIWEASTHAIPIQMDRNMKKSRPPKPAAMNRNATQLALFRELCEQNLTDGFRRSGRLLDMETNLQSNSPLRCPCIPENLRE